MHFLPSNKYVQNWVSFGGTSVQLILSSLSM
jgi:hypothetical protein